MAEIEMEHSALARPQHSLLPWLIGLVLLALLVIGLAMAVVGPGRSVEGVPEVGKAQEKRRDETPRRLQQWAAAPTRAVVEAEPARAA